MIAAFCFLLLPSSLYSETPQEALTRLESEWMRSDGFGWDYYIFSANLAKEHGTELITAILDKSVEWKGEEGLVYAPVIELLPREETVEILRSVETDDKKRSLWAHEFLVEFEMSDVRSAVRMIDAWRNCSPKARFLFVRYTF